MKNYLENLNLSFPSGLSNLTNQFKRPWVAFGIMFVFGCLIFIPLDRIQGLILDQARKAGLKVTMGPMAITRGVFPEGGLLGISARAFRYEIGFNKSLECDEVKISPQIWRLLLLQLQTAVVCKRSRAGTLYLTVRSGVLFKMSKPTIFADLKDVDLSVFGDNLGISGLKGVARGSLEVSELDATTRTGLPGEMNLSLDFAGLQSPPINDSNVGLALPAIPLENASLRMTADNGNVDLKLLRLGSPKNPRVFGEFKGRFKMQPVLGMMFPNGDLAGRIRVDKELEDIITSSTSINGLFGTVKPSGFREFKKKHLSTPQSLLFPPEA